MSNPDSNNTPKKFVRPLILKPGEAPPSQPIIQPRPTGQPAAGKPGTVKPGTVKPGTVKPGAGNPAARPIPGKTGVARPLPYTPPAQQPVDPNSPFAFPQPEAGPKVDLPFQLDASQNEDEGPVDITDEMVQGAPPWLVSAIFHIVVILAMALWMLPEILGNNNVLVLISEPDPPEVPKIMEEEGVQAEVETEVFNTEEEPMAEEFSDAPLPEVEDPTDASPQSEAEPVETTEKGVATTDFKATDPGMAFSGRNRGSKKGLMGKYGGNATTEQAVRRGLEWLKRKQFKDGSWSLLGRYPNGAQDENQISATAMALLAFQGNGHTHKVGDFKPQVAKGWKWLLAKQSPDGDFVWEEGLTHNHPFYTQGQVTIALCELYGMTEDKTFRAPAEKAVKYLIDSQGLDGGWRYEPKTPQSDLSVTGWIVIALQSARMAKIDVPQETLDKIMRFLDRIAQAGGTRYPYQKNEKATRVMTAEAILCRQYLGWAHDDDRMKNALDYVLTEPINFNSNRDVYYWYYATQAMHHMEGKHWTDWNAVMRQELPTQQIKLGPEAGSWDPANPSRDAWEPQGGRLYVTCLSIYMLEVYYRHLPIYANVYDLLDEEGQQKAKAEAEARQNDKPAEEKPADDNPVEE